MNMNNNNNDALIATRIVGKIFYHINLCLENDRSKIKLTMLEKGIIRGMLSNKTLNGINGFVLNMHPREVKNLMNDISAEIAKRKM